MLFFDVLFLYVLQLFFTLKVAKCVHIKLGGKNLTSKLFSTEEKKYILNFSILFLTWAVSYTSTEHLAMVNDYVASSSEIQSL